MLAPQVALRLLVVVITSLVLFSSTHPAAADRNEGRNLQFLSLRSQFVADHRAERMSLRHQRNPGSVLLGQTRERLGQRRTRLWA